MDKLKSIFKITFFLSAVLFISASCSDDKEEPAPQPSRLVKQVRIYHSADDTKLLTTLTFDYDTKGRLIKVYSSEPLGVVNYTYPANDKVTYTYASASSTLVEVSTDLEDGRSYSCSFSDKENDTNYLYDNGYLKTSKNGNLELKYSWDNGNLKSIVSSPSALYNNKFNASDIANDYSIDLNTLPQLVDKRADYQSVVNIYGQMAGILGERSKNIIENTEYLYDYSFDKEGRLKQLSVVADGEAYTFRIACGENILE